ncbi:hypothetical protein Mzhil_1792 [Methanosalsum zhilinae DSM 4017]|uniref:Transcriptional regulator, ArsR family n=1 Tax=Methanosalsum zhilinae (strain DSM 4017 / NBRC 107636 / OCM 62 / WeN5) TaxID=679901 RepID=F7XQM8_METZD|nr:helix-turn-helix domain-containing protein [Methanosalsum zhilinae]AEH61627.1 hypothetical protein Mzhil_1792 [Methanosalsum zhilinae DSM 4017]
MYNETDISNRENSHKGIEDMPPSAKLVYKVLEYRGFLTPKEIARESQLPPRTVRYALSRLKGGNFLMEKFCFRDARQILYGVKDNGTARAAASGQNT